MPSLGRTKLAKTIFIFDRYAVVIEANKGIGFEICRQLASQEITVVLNARDERRGLDSFHKLKGTDALSSDLLFHQLDVAEPSSVASIAEFIKARFGRLDILVNNAGVGGSIVDSEAFKKAVVSFLCKLKLAKIEFAIGFKIAFFF
ncbi:unnamed protein product [Coffea canephora]|uniref:Uncharacterized protein n=1 Tax=Coffea canephora TaxID=49390 RepID=A0A068UKU6_COFCA|nr:unnamed protein product [Coffea canephora]